MSYTNPNRIPDTVLRRLSPMGQEVINRGELAYEALNDIEGIDLDAVQIYGGIAALLLLGLILFSRLTGIMYVPIPFDIDGEPMPPVPMWLVWAVAAYASAFRARRFAERRLFPRRCAALEKLLYLTELPRMDDVLELVVNYDTRHSYRQWAKYALRQGTETVAA